jgi:hypothetical protein
MKRVLALLAVVAALLAATGCSNNLHVKDVDQGKIDRMIDTLATDEGK